MRFKIVWVGKTQTDRWGHIISSSKPTVEYATTLTDAYEKAQLIHRGLSKEVQIYDTEGPLEKDSNSTVWLVCVYIDECPRDNKEYDKAVKALKQQQS